MITVVKRGQPLREGIVRFSVGRASSGVGRGCIPAHALGNPSRLTNEAKREKNIAEYELWLNRQINNQNPEVRKTLNLIFTTAKRGEVELECFCHPKACHADVIKKIIEEKLRSEGKG
jgi:hypothetical protein